MRNKIYSILLVLVALVCAYYSASFFGKIYNDLFPNELNSGWIGGGQSLYFLRGISLSLLFFMIMFTYPWVFKTVRKTMWFLIPIALWEIAFDPDKIYIPIILSLIGFSLAWLVRKGISKFRHHNLPMVINK